MRLEEFKSGEHKEQFQYKSFQPTGVNHVWIWEDSQVDKLLSEANRWLGELNAYSKILPDVDTYIRMHALKEANSSSRIEGTQTHMETAAKPKDQVAPEQRDDWEEVQNYLKAMDVALESLEKVPLSVRTLNETHKRLIAGVRGEQKTPGERRRSQNWIGGSGLSDATFIPPHHDDVADLLSDLEGFWHNDHLTVPHLIRIAISHYQFETIHPYLDGNGRIGRLLITLYLMDKQLLTKPCLYVSAFLEKNRSSYYDSLMTVRTQNNLIQWVCFFLNAIIDTARSAVETFRKIMDLKESLQQKCLTLGRKADKASELLHHLYLQPYVDVMDVNKLLGVTSATSNKLLQDFVSIGVLKEVTGYKRNRLYYFEDYMRLFLGE